MVSNNADDIENHGCACRFLMRMTQKAEKQRAFWYGCPSFYKRRSAKNMTSYICHKEQRNKLVLLITGSWNGNCAIYIYIYALCSLGLYVYIYISFTCGSDSSQELGLTDNPATVWPSAGHNQDRFGREPTRNGKHWMYKRQKRATDEARNWGYACMYKQTPKDTVIQWYSQQGLNLEPISDVEKPMPLDRLQLGDSWYHQFLASHWVGFVISCPIATLITW